MTKEIIGFENACELSLQVLVHDPLVMPRVANDGFRVKAGSSVYAEITKREVNL